MEHKFGGPWTIIKLEMLKNYLNSYTSVFKNMKWYHLIYLDAFAGTGRCTTTQGIIDGSTRIALENDRFNEYIFIEENPEYIDQLKQLRSEFSSKKITIIQGNCNDIISNVIKQYNWNKCRALAFLDPYSMELSFNTLESLSETRAFDLWYLFPLSAVTRTMPNNGKISSNSMKKLNNLFGNTDWKDDLYEQDPQINVFDILNNERKIRRKSQSEICCYFHKRLTSVFPSVLCPVCLKNSNNAPLFLLYFAVSNPSYPAQRAANNIAHHLIRRDGTYVCKNPKKSV